MSPSVPTLPVSEMCSCQDYGVSFMETSAKTAQNVDNAFMSVARCANTPNVQDLVRGGHSRAFFSVQFYTKVQF